MLNLLIPETWARKFENFSLKMSSRGITWVCFTMGPKNFCLYCTTKTDCRSWRFPRYCQKNRPGLRWPCRDSRQQIFHSPSFLWPFQECGIYPVEKFFYGILEYYLGKIFVRSRERMRQIMSIRPLKRPYKENYNCW